MAYKASHKFCRIAPRKARLVADLIRGRGVADALTELEFSKRRGAYFVQGVLKSAIANAEQASADVSRLVVVESRFDEGPPITRFQQNDRGRAHPIMKRTRPHIRGAALQ